jgi:ABC-type molybdate transport system substrate-binding protein
MNLKGLGLALVATLSWGSTVPAADVKVLASNSVRTMLEDIAPLFERASGHTVTLGFGTSAQVASARRRPLARVRPKRQAAHPKTQANNVH